MVFIGYESGTKGYRVYDPVFVEDASLDWSTHEDNPVSTAFTVDCYVHSTRLHCVPLHLRWQARTRRHQLSIDTSSRRAHVAGSVILAHRASLSDTRS